jgi:hypothetical protein
VVNGPVAVKPASGRSVGSAVGPLLGSWVGVTVEVPGAGVWEPAAIEEGEDVPWEPPETARMRPAPTSTATSATIPMPTIIGVELRRAGAGA